MTTKLSPTPCLGCGKILDIMAKASGVKLRPQPGHLTICIYCGHMMIFDAQLRLRELTVEEIMTTTSNSKVMALQKVREWLNKKVPLL